MLLALANNFGSESSLGTLSKEFMIVFGDINFLLNGIKFLNSNSTCGIKTVSNLEWMNTFIEKLLSLFEDGTGEDDYTSSSISNFIILRSRELDQKSSGLMMDL